MAIVIEFNFPGTTVQQYEEVSRGLEAKGLAAPQGRQYHVAAPSDTGWFVVDVWDSVEQFNTFGETLMPLLEAAGIPNVLPEIREVHNIIQ